MLKQWHANHARSVQKCNLRTHIRYDQWLSASSPPLRFPSNSLPNSKPMSSLLRKVWGSVSNRPNSNSSSSDRRREMVLAQSSTGAFDRIPFDILIQILKLLGPKEAAKLSSVCKSWKLIVAENRLWMYFLQNQQESWDSIFFGETQLRLGYPLQALPNQISQLSFMHIYGQRAQVPGAIIIDVGLGYCKFGWSKYACPSGRFATFVEFGNIESPTYTRLRHFFGTIYNRMRVKTSTHPIVVSIPICHYDDTESAKASRRQLKETMYSVLFDMNVPAVCAINQATLALYAARRTSGIVVNIGFHQTSVVPILHGQVMRKVGVEVVGMGALKLTGFLKEQMQQKNIHFESLYTVRTLKEFVSWMALEVLNSPLESKKKYSSNRQGYGMVLGSKWIAFARLKVEKRDAYNSMSSRSLKSMARHPYGNLCYVALDYDAELSKDTEGSFEVAAEGWFTLSKERFQTGEILFQPCIAGVRAMSLQQAVALCMDHCQAAELTGDDSWFKTVVLSGGTACLPGLAERLEKELHGLIPQSMSNGIIVIPPVYGADSAWFGAKLISNLSTFPGPWCMVKKQFRYKSRHSLLW
ncbi:unnamed protein product [Camellia sinensis]